MSIKIKRSDNGSCIIFEGSSQPAYWYSCLQAEVDGEDATRVNVINLRRSASNSATEYELYKIPYTEFLDADGNGFADAPAAAAYITLHADVTGSSNEGGTVFPQTEFMDFERDDTNTTIMFSNGDSYGVNSIKAVDAGDGTFDLKTTRGDVTLYSGMNHENMTIGEASAGATLNGVINALNAYFTVQPIAGGGDYVTSYVADDTGVDVTGNDAEGQVPVTGTPTHLLTTGSDTSTGHGARYWSNETIDESGEYFTVKMTGQGRFILGLVDDSDADDIAELSNNTGNGHSGLLWGLAVYDYGSYKAPWTTYGTGGLSMGPGWTGTQSGMMRYNTDVQDAFDNMNPVAFKVGIDNNGYIAVWYYDAGRSDDWILCGRRGTTTGSGHYRLVVKIWDSNGTLVETPKVHHLPVDDTGSALLDSNITLINDATGTIAGGITVLDATGDNDGIVTDQTISSIGEYFEFTWSVGDSHVGLFSDNDYDVATMAADSSEWSNDDYFFLGARAENNGTFTSVYRDESGADIDYRSVGSGDGAAFYGRAGFDTQGRATIWGSADGINWFVYKRHNAAAPSGNYRFLFIAQDDGANLDTLTQGTLDLAVSLTYYYAESPDGVFNYPLFATSEEAEQYDTDQGGAGAHQEVMFVDDTVGGRVWYAPSTGYYTSDGNVAPSDTGSVTWNAVATLSDALFAPDAFNGSDYTVDEGASVNIAISPVDVNYVTTVSISPSGSGLSLVANNLEGTAPEVTGDYNANPTDVYTVTVTRTNNYGTSTGTFDITVTNLTAPTVAATGFTHVTGSTALVDSDTLDDGSAVTFDNTIASPRRFLIPQAWVNDNILPSVVSSGSGTNSNPGTAGRTYIGIKAASGDLTDGITDADFDMFFNWEYQTANGHRFRHSDGTTVDNIGIGGTTNALYDFAVEVDGTDVHFIACNVNNISNEPAVNQGGTFSRVKTVTSYSGTFPIELVIATNGVQADIDTTGLNTIIIPAPSNWIQITEIGSHVINFDGSTTMPTLNAGYTYRFLTGSKVYADQTTNTNLHSDETLRFTTDGVSEYTTGITRVGTVGTAGAYIEFAVPSDVPPLFWYTDHTGINTNNAATISGSTYTVSITGITLEGPAANQTGSNVMDAGDHGWISLDEQLHAGERLVLNNTFFSDFMTEFVDNNHIVAIGLKGDNWVNTFEVNSAQAANSGEIFKGNTYIVGVCNSNGTGVLWYVVANGAQGNVMGTTAITPYSSLCAFFDITSTGNNIRAGIGYNGNLGVSAGDESTVAYADWTAYKGQTGDQGYGITTRDVVMSFWSFDGGDIDGAEIDWTGLSEVSTPTAAASLTTSWTKAIDFSGSSERMQQVANGTSYNPIRMNDISTTVAAPTAGHTSNDTNSRPWHTAIVFSSDNHNSNQHIWNQGDGAGSTDDNIYLRVDSSRNLWFGWGRTGALNECSLGTLASGSGNWYGIYIAHTGERLSGANASAANLADCFEIFYVNLQTGIVGSNMSIASNWTTNGGRMDRAVTNVFTVGGRGSNRNFHGKVASMVVSTLRRNQVMPATAEVSMMVRDPKQWLTDYKIGVSYRRPANSGNESSFSLNSSFSDQSCQVWLMGDGANDAYAQIRNQVFPSLANQTPLNMISMVSNDIETVNISGLT